MQVHNVADVNSEQMIVQGYKRVRIKTSHRILVMAVGQRTVLRGAFLERKDEVTWRGTPQNPHIWVNLYKGKGYVLSTLL